MSQLLDSLRRASRLAPARERGAKHPPPAAILATMGYSAARERRGSRIGLLVLAGTVLVALAWSAFVASSRASNRESVDQSGSTADRAAGLVDSTSSDQRHLTSRGTLAGSMKKGDPVSARLPATSSEQAPASVVASARFQAAIELHREGQLDAAVSAYQELIEGDELVAASHNNLGLVHHLRGNPAEAIRQFERALVRDPEYARAHNNLGVVLLGQGRIDAAVERFSRAARLDPGDPDALVNLALAQKAGGGTEEAKESLLRALGLAPDSAPAHYNLAVLYDRSGDARRAVEHYRAFLDHSRAEHASRAADVRARLAVLDRPR